MINKRQHTTLRIKKNAGSVGYSRVVARFHFCVT